MAGRFNGLRAMAWQLLADIFPPAPPRRSRGMPRTPFRKVVNIWLDVLSTGWRWGDLPRGPQWASKRAAHRWLQRWHVDGTRAAMQARLLGIAEAHGRMRWPYGAVDGACSPWHRRR
jgi:transposase